MTDPALIDKANEVITRLFALDEAIDNTRAFRALLEDLQRRNPLDVREPHVLAVAMVRAGILRAAISIVMACLDVKDKRGNRASVGQILDMLLRDEKLVAIFPEPGTPSDSGMAALQQVKRRFENLLSDDLYKNGKRLRNDTIAHLLITDDPTPIVHYETIYRLHDEAEQLVIELYEVCYRGRPNFLDHQAKLTAHAKVFWDTYFRGMS